MRGSSRSGSFGVLRDRAWRRSGASVALTAGLLVLLTALAAVGAGEPLVRASVSTTGVQANEATSAISMSSNGRYLAFVSGASNLVANDTNNFADVFIRDLPAGTTQIASLGVGGVLANGPSHEVSLGQDRRWLAFTSSATNLVAAGGNERKQLFFRDQQTGTITRLSENAEGEPADADVEGPFLTWDGAYVVFTSRASNLVAGGANAKSQTYLVDLATGQIERISVTPTGAPGNGDSREAFVSVDGRFVAFHSEATNLVGSGADGRGDIFVRDRQLGLTRLLSQDVATVASHCTHISYNGELVAYTVPADGQRFAFDQVAVANAFRNQVRILSRGIDYDFNGDSGQGKLIGGGESITFRSEATNVLGNDPSRDTNGVADIFVAKVYLPGGIYEARLASRTASNGPANAASLTHSISGDAKQVAFLSSATNLVLNDTNARIDAFVRDRTNETLNATALTELSSDGPTRLTARWHDNNSTETGYEVELAKEDGPFVQVTVTGESGAFRLITGLSPNTRYRCRVRAVNAVDTAEYSPEFVGYTRPETPRNVVAAVVPRTTKIKVTWQPPVGGAESYRVYADGSPHGEEIPGAGPLEFTFWPWPGGGTHTYQVAAANRVRELSKPSPTAIVLALPEAPNLPIVTAGPTRVEVSWSPALGAAAYRVKRAERPEGPFTILKDALRQTSYSDVNPPPGKSLYYAISALNASGEGPDSPVQSVKSAPAPPGGVQAIANFESVLLSWQPSSGASSYVVLRSDTRGGPYTARAMFVYSTTYTDHAEPGKTYFYVVQARGESSVSANSTEIAVTTAPATPNGLTATPGSGKVTLAWTAVPGATGYRLRRNLSGSSATTTIGGNLSATRYVDSGLGGGKTYQYRVVAYNSAGESRASAPTEATTLPVLTSLTLKPTSVKGGKKATATVTLDAPAPATGTTIILTSDNPTLVKLPASVRVPSGKTSFKFQFSTRKLKKKQKPTSVQITAKLEEKTVTATLRVKK